MPRIKILLAREILDSRGFPTVEVEVHLESGKSAYASVPSGASTGSLEALELRDNNPKRYMGKGVQKALQNILEVIAPEIKNHSFESQADLDNLLLKLEGTPNKSKLGANALLAVSLAYAKACALEVQQPLYQYLASLCQGSLCMPVPMMNILNGGAHADNNVDIQEFMILPVGAKDWPEALRLGTEVYHALKSVLKADHLSTTVGDEGGFAPNLKSNQEALDKIMAAIEKAGFIPGKEIYLGLDVAANELYQNDHYVLEAEGSTLSASKLIDQYEAWINAYPILSIEDGMAENDVTGWQEITKRLGKRVQLVGDDVFVTNPKLLSQGLTASCTKTQS